MSKTFRPYDPGQQLLLPAALQEWLPPDHLAYFISDVVDQLDLSAITARYQGEERGGPPYHPRMMVKVLLYGYCTGVSSSRRIAQRLHEDIAFRVLLTVLLAVGLALVAENDVLASVVGWALLLNVMGSPGDMLIMRKLVPYPRATSFEDTGEGFVAYGPASGFELQ